MAGRGLWRRVVVSSVLALLLLGWLLTPILVYGAALTALGGFGSEPTDAQQAAAGVLLSTAVLTGLGFPLVGALVAVRTVRWRTLWCFLVALVTSVAVVNYVSILALSDLLD